MTLEEYFSQMPQEEKEIWLQTPSAKIIEMPDGREIGVTMENWYWVTLEWIDRVVAWPVHEIVETVETHNDENGFEYNLKQIINYTLSRWLETETQAG
jgi:predicted DNA-binding ribbon-helix-helix protein